LFSLSKAELSDKANEFNFVRDTMEKVLRLADILEYLNTNSLTKNALALKGGTAINLTSPYRYRRYSSQRQCLFSHANGDIFEQVKRAAEPRCCP